MELYSDNGKEYGSYCIKTGYVKCELGFCFRVVFRQERLRRWKQINNVEVSSSMNGTYWGCIGIMGKKMGITIEYIGFI